MELFQRKMQRKVDCGIKEEIEVQVLLPWEYDNINDSKGKLKTSSNKAALHVQQILFIKGTCENDNKDLDNYVYY